MKIDVQSVSYWYPDRKLYITDMHRKEHIVLAETRITVKWINLQEKEETQEMAAKDLAPYLAVGYSIVSIEYQE